MSSSALKSLAPAEVRAFDPGYKKFVEKPREEQAAAQLAADQQNAAITAQQQAMTDQANAPKETRQMDATVRREALAQRAGAAGATRFQNDYDLLGGTSAKRRSAAATLLG